MSYRTKLTHEVGDVLAALDRALTMYEQMATELATRQLWQSLDSRMTILKTLTEGIVDKVQLETLRKAGYDGSVRVVRKPTSAAGFVSSKPGRGLPTQVPVPRPISGGRRSGRAIAGAARSA